MKEEIGKRVQDARTKAGFTQELLAEKSNVSSSVISRLETGRTMVSIDKLYRIAQALNVGLQDLLYDFCEIDPIDASLTEELNFQISLMKPSQKEYLLEYVKLYNKFHN